MTAAASSELLALRECEPIRNAELNSLELVWITWTPLSTKCLTLLIGKASWVVTTDKAYDKNCSIAAQTMHKHKR